MRTLIESAWTVAHDGNRHVLLTDAICVIEGMRVTHLGGDYRGPRPDVVISGGHLLVTPGLISTHMHAGTNASDEVFLDPGRRDAFGRNYLNWQAKREGAPRYAPDARVKAAFGLARALLSGVTTVVEIGAGGAQHDEFLKAVKDVGLRVYTGLSFRDATIHSRPDGSLSYSESRKRGKAQLERAVEFARRLEGMNSSRIRPILCPGHPDTCSPDLLRDALALGGELPITIHAAINPDEMKRCLDRHRLTPVELLADVGLLTSRTLLGHAVFVTGHSASRLSGTSDLELIAESGAAVAHAPAKYLAMGFVMESWETYRARGIPVTVGTDCSPADIVREMQAVTIGARVADRDFRSGLPRDVFTAATITAADHLNRPELGRLSPGGVADLAVFDLDDFRFGAVVDPIRSLIDYGSAANVHSVFVEGRRVVAEGRLTGIDHAQLLRRGREEARRELESVANWSWGGRTAEEMAPPTFARQVGGERHE